MSEVTKRPQNDIAEQGQRSVTERRQSSTDEYRRKGAPSFACPQCRSTEIQRFSVAYQSGISKVSTKTTGIGMSLSGKIGIGGAKTKGHSQTELSRITAPPERHSYGIWFGCGLIVYLFLAILLEGYKVPGRLANILAIIGGWGPALFFMVRAFRFNRDVYPQRMQRWKNSWICFRCGHKFVM